MKRLQTLAQSFLGWPLSILALYFIVKSILPKLPQVEKNLTHIQPVSILVALCFFLLYYLFRSIVWYIIISEKNPAISYRASTFLWGTSEIKRYIPGNIWSFLSRTVLFEKLKVKKFDTAHALLIEAEFIIFGLLIVSLGGILFLLQTYTYGLNTTVVMAILVAFIALLFWLFLLPNRLTNLLSNIKDVLLKLSNTMSIRDTFSSLLFSVAAFMCLGLGYYFAISSLVFLHPQQIIEYMGFFTISLLIGLVSFITPAGLGVREGVITVVLSRIGSTSLAGAAALLSRLILVISELLFLTISYILYKLHEKPAKWIEKIWQNHKSIIILTCLWVLYCIYFGWISFLRYDNFYAGRFDLGNMDQTVWNTLHGRVFQFTNPNNTYNLSRLAFHADFILVLLAPLYRIWSSPKMLLLIQTIVLGGGCYFVYFLALDKLKHKGLSLLLASMYLLNPSIERVNIFDFHPVALATTLLLGAFYFLEKKRYIWFGIFALLAAVTKEQIWIILSLFGLYMVFVQKKRLIGIGVTVVAFMIFYFLVSYAIPHAGGSQHFALSYYSDFGDKPSKVIKNIIFSPQKTFSALMTKDRLVYIEQLFLPLGFLPLIGLPLLLFAGPELLINMLSNNTQAHQIYYQYSSAITPFLFIATIYGIFWIQRRYKQIHIWHILLFLSFFALHGSHLYSPLPSSREPNLDMIVRQQEDRVLIDTILRRIPKRYSVASSNNIGAHLSHRQNIYTLPVGKDQADLIILLLNDPTAQPSLTSQKQLAANLKQDKTYRLVYERGDFIIFKKRKDK